MSKKETTLNHLEKEVEKLLYDRYKKTYFEDRYVECCIDSKIFQGYLKLDRRIQEYYLGYKKLYNEDISIEDFINQKMEIILDKFIDTLLDMPEGMKQNNIYLDEPYTFKFYIKNIFAPSYKDYKEEMLIQNYQRVTKMFGFRSHPGLEELQQGLLMHLKHLNFKEEEAKRLMEARRKKPKKKIIKVDKDNNLLATYNSRKECIEKEGFSKVSLSNHLSGRRHTLNGYIFKEIDR